MRRSLRAGLTLVLAAVALGLGGCRSDTSKNGLTVRQEKDRVVLHWKGPVEHPMRDKIAEALDEFADDPRKIVISLNSPGGLIEHGHAVIRVVRKASRERAIDTVISEGSTCASMCVPIFLIGAERTAHPRAQFMFHMASVRFPEETERQLRRYGHGAVENVRQELASRATRDMFEVDLGPRSIDREWLEKLRRRVNRGNDIWFTGRQLMEQGSGVLDRLL